MSQVCTAEAQNSGYEAATVRRAQTKTLVPPQALMG